MTKKGDVELRKLMAEHPDMPLMAKCPSLPCDYDSYYLDVCGAYVETILKPDDVKKKYGHYFGLDSERYYWDEDEAIEDVGEHVFDTWFDVALTHGMENDYSKTPDGLLTEFCDAESGLGDFSEDLAKAIVEDMPWQDYIMVDCW